MVCGAGGQPSGDPVATLMPSGSALAVGSVRHRRYQPRDHAFRYRTYHALIDLDDLPRLDREVVGFGYRRAAVTSWHDVDHFGPQDLPSREKLRRWLEAQGAELPRGPIRVLTNLRVLGHVFNPVSWWFCHAPDGRLEVVVAEVNNTFGDAHAYLLNDLRHGHGGVVTARTDKALHVSPFLGIEGLSYAFTFVIAAARITVRMEVRGPDGLLLDATQDGRLRPLTSSRLARTLLTHPLMTLRTVAQIHLQALRLWVKRVPFVPRPEPIAGSPDPSPTSRRTAS